MKSKQGQSLIELIIAITIIQVGLFSVWSLFLYNFNAQKEAEMRIVGINLAREGVEVAKNMRDSNWLKRRNNILDDDNNIIDWDNKLSAGNYYVSSIDEKLLLADGENDYQLYSDNENFFISEDVLNFSDKKKTPFSRKIIIYDICCDDNDGNFQCDDFNYYDLNNSSQTNCPLKIGIKVVGETSWSLNGNFRKAIIETDLYDWQQ